ncbi:unnamed protein product (macronuclear) [Paramecium tetraurelia]|uniref:Uncharacterized protein n=1 Tax=Paramecium tetraurelia TaxID=5888 RepID=A0EFF6_PARTE|nr:uncharacterized protein GSPATT00026370001 [Paramecium tetraurelia]CAK94047.1 unnamed protein product [Paramecium tetraurelia]|eukprot:XP_001461420.1 hypothetical protein (macronuclear) [Paramecium tetraurelia strain d4-2]
MEYTQVEADFIDMIQIVLKIIYSTQQKCRFSRNEYDFLYYINLRSKVQQILEAILKNIKTSLKMSQNQILDSDSILGSTNSYDKCFYLLVQEFALKLLEKTVKDLNESAFQNHSYKIMDILSLQHKQKGDFVIMLEINQRKVEELTKESTFQHLLKEQQLRIRGKSLDLEENFELSSLDIYYQI